VNAGSRRNKPVTRHRSKEDKITDEIDTTKLPLAKKVRAGLSWNISSSLIAEAIRFARSVVLARLLVPEYFGLFAMALTVVGALNAVSSLGLGRTIVANKFDSDDELKPHLNTNLCSSSPARETPTLRQRLVV
jgi:Polysaccharide biosynthesis protein